MAKSIQTTNFFTENEKKKFFWLCFLGYLSPKTHFKHRFFLIFFFRTTQKMAKSIQTTNFFTENEKKIIIFWIGFLGYLGPKTHFKHDFFLLFFSKFFWNFQISDPPSGKTMWVPTSIFFDSDSVYPILPIWHGLNV